MFFLFQGGGDIYTFISGVYIFFQIVERYTKTLKSKLTLTDLSERTIELGFNDGQSFSITENHILLLYKRYIYISRIHGKSINLIRFKLFLKDVIRIEENIAHNNNILTLHYQQWEVVREVLDT